MKLNQNFISVNKDVARSSYGEFFEIGETVRHQDEDAGEAVIESFEIDERTMEIKVNTTKGYAHLDFLIKI